MQNFPQEVPNCILKYLYPGIRSMFYKHCVIFRIYKQFVSCGKIILIDYCIRLHRQNNLQFYGQYIFLFPLDSSNSYKFLFFLSLYPYLPLTFSPFPSVSSLLSFSGYLSFFLSKAALFSLPFNYTLRLNFRHNHYWQRFYGNLCSDSWSLSYQVELKEKGLKVCLGSIIKRIMKIMSICQWKANESETTQYIIY